MQYPYRPSAARSRLATWLSLSLAAVMARPAQADDTSVSLQWLLMDYPPAYIVTGNQAGHGYQDQVLNYFAEALPGFRIDRQPAVLARILSNLEHGKATCAGALGRTPERERFMVFSKPVIFSLPIRLVVRSDAADGLAPYLDAGGKVDLGRLRGSTLRAGAVQGRTYGDPLDDFIRDSDGRQTLSAVARPELVFRMLERGRFDYTFAYPDEAGYYARIQGGADTVAGFSTFPIAGLPDVAPSYFACTNDAAGRQFIDAANRVIDQYQALSPWMLYYLDWIDGNARRDLEAVLHASNH